MCIRDRLRPTPLRADKLRRTPEASLRPVAPRTPESQDQTNEQAIQSGAHYRQGGGVAVRPSRPLLMLSRFDHSSATRDLTRDDARANDRANAHDRAPDRGDRVRDPGRGCAEFRHTAHERQSRHADLLTEH